MRRSSPAWAGVRSKASATSVLAYDRAHHTALQVAGFLISGASVPLAIWTATVYRRLRVRNPGT